jgi:hypothetical protein
MGTAEDSAVPDLTIFATPKRFTDRFDRIQRNAITSWARLGPAVEVILIGNDEGTAELAVELGLRHVPEVATSPKGIPLLSDLWAIGQREASAPVALFANADIILFDDVLAAVAAVRAHHDRFLLIGQRTDLELEDTLGDLGEDWACELRRRARVAGTVNSPLWVDWFAFPVGQYPELLPCIIGRPGYDHWLVWHTLERSIPVIDATDAVLAVHQHHDYSHGGGKVAVYEGPDAAYNYGLIGGRKHLRHIGHATERLTPHLDLAPARGAKYALSALHHRASWVIGATAPWRHRVGLDAEALQRLSRRAG